MTPKQAPSGKASEDALWKLHSLLLKALLDGLENPPPGGCRPTFLEVARAFAKDNGIISEGGTTGRSSLADQLRELSRQRDEG